MHFIHQHKYILILIVLSLAFFCVYSFFGGPNYNSPDETANYFWIQKYTQDHELSYTENLNPVARNLLHPRSVNVVGDQVVPGSFLGQIIIFGTLAKIFSPQMIPYLTPFFSTLGIIFFYLIISKIFQQQMLGFISATLLFFFPGWWYYSSRGLYHNILFLSLLLMGIYFLIYILNSKQEVIEVKESQAHFREVKYNFGFLDKITPKKPFLIENFIYLISGLLIGLSLSVRTSELVWISILIVLILLTHFHKINWWGLLLFVAGVVIGLLPTLYYNQILYGSIISAGYNTTGIPAHGLSQAVNSGVLVKILITPFGFNLKSALINSFNYLFRLMPIWSVPSLLGLLLFVFLPTAILKINPGKKILILVSFVIIATYLIIFYGSWSLTDRIDETTLSLGTSYLRYWLPIYLFSIPFLSLFIYSFISLLRYTWLKSIVASVLIFILFLASANLVLVSTDESLLSIKNTLSISSVKQQKIQGILTDPNSVIITYKQADKILFPFYKRLITELASPKDYRAVASLAQTENIYYYTFAPKEVVAYISQRDFEPYGLIITDGQKVFEKDWVYQIKKK